MIRALRPLGTLLAALALWSLALLVLAMAGLGARVGLHPANPALAPALPQVSLAAVGSRLGPPSDYLEVGSRPLLSSDRRPAPVTDAGEDDAETPFEVTLTSVLIAGEVKLAIVQNKQDGKSLRVRLGDMVEGTAWRLVELEPRRAVFEGPQGRRELDLRVFDGNGVATAVSGPPRPAPSARPADGGGANEAGTEAPPATAATAEAGGEMTQEQQVEAIRRRIEARRAQMRAENARRNGQQVE